MNLNALIIDDEFNAREEMEFLLNQVGSVNVLKKCSNALDGVRSINSLHPDVVFLDVQLPSINGFDMLSMVEESILPRVVFVTAYDKYAIEAFENDAVDYLLKPVESDRLKKTVEKLLNAIQQNKVQKLNLPPLSKIPSVGTNKVKLIDIECIEFVHSDETGVFVVCSDKKYFTEITLKVLENRTNLFRCHKQYLINPDKIDEIIFDENSAGKIKTISQHIIPISRHYLKELKEKLGI